MRLAEVIAWESDAEAWMLAARGEPSTAALHSGFLSVWNPVSTRTLAAILMWTHSGWGLSDPQQRPTVDFTSVNVLSAAVLQQVSAQLARGDRRSIPELAVEAHLDATERLLGGTPYFDEEIPSLKFCTDCLWQHLKSLASAAAGIKALQWFANPQHVFQCTDHLQALNKVLNRLKAAAPGLQDAEWELTSLEVGSTLLKYSPLVVPGTVSLILPSLMVTGFVGAALISPPPEPGMVLKPLPHHERRMDRPFVAPVTDEAGKPVVTKDPKPSKQKKEPSRGTPAAPPDEMEPGPGAQSASTKPAVKNGPPSSLNITPVSHGKGNLSSKSVPVLSGKHGGAGTSGSPKPAAITPFVTPVPPKETPGLRSTFNMLAYRLLILLQKRGSACMVEGRVFSVSADKMGLLIDGFGPQIKDIALMRVALKECQK